jgi:antitoxin VapB
VTRSTVFTSNRSQAVRLPKPVALPPNVRQVEITKLGRSRLISPVDQSWDSFFEGPTASEDFMTERHQPAAESAWSAMPRWGTGRRWRLSLGCVSADRPVG